MFNWIPDTFIVMTEGHCFAGVWLVETTLSRLIAEDCSEIRKAIAAKELVTFETTMITTRRPARFEDSVRTATAATREPQESSFVAAEEVEVAPTTAEGRIDRWQRKLLDLSLRNRLLNCRSGQQSVPFLCPDISRLEDRLAEEAKVRIISAPEENPIGDRDLELHQQSTGQDLQMEFMRKALERLKSTAEGSVGGFDSPFEEAVSAIERGVLGFRLIRPGRESTTDWLRFCHDSG